MGLVAPWRVESSQTRDRTHISCVGRWILNHWSTREVHNILFFNLGLSLPLGIATSVQNHAFNGISRGLLSWGDGVPWSFRSLSPVSYRVVHARQPWIRDTAGFVSRWGGRCEGRGSTVVPGLNCENPFLPCGQHKQNDLLYLTRTALVQSHQQKYLWIGVIYCLLEKIQCNQIRWPVSAAYMLEYENSTAIWGPNFPLPFCCYFYYSMMGRLGPQL